MQLLSSAKFVISKISTNRPKPKIFILKNSLEGGVISKIGSKGEFFSLRFEEFFIRMIILQKVILYTPGISYLEHLKITALE